jgi:carbohydrate kinase (thermoresistant glucokinase family)
MVEPGQTGCVIACSALKRAYRDEIRLKAPDAVFVHLNGSRELLASRLSGRKHEYMPSSLLDSQLAILEPLEQDEQGFEISIEDAVSRQVELILAQLRG